MARGQKNVALVKALCGMKWGSPLKMCATYRSGSPSLCPVTPQGDPTTPSWHLFSGKNPKSHSGNSHSWPEAGKAVRIKNEMVHLGYFSFILFQKMGVGQGDC